ncbi:MAG: DUF192 domain-containing protein [Candidatus Pacebacteria bacterium]|nr:DUF192 domain-containing protein [Candidatus Paceibacterota bacterium]
MKKRLPVGLIIILGIGLVFWINRSQYSFDMNNSNINTISQDNSLSKIKIGDLILNVEVVRDTFLQSKGLSGREEIGSDGMLFVFPSERIPTFWMKEMSFDLDMIWIKDGRVFEITRDVPKPANYDDQLELYSPSQPIDQILEVYAGDSLRLGIEVGDEFTQIK